MARSFGRCAVGAKREVKQMASIVFVVNGLEWDKHQQSKHGKAKGNMLVDSTIKKYKDHTV